MNNPGDSQNRFLDTETAAAYLGGLKKATLERWRSAGGGPVFYKLGGRCFYRKEDLDAYARSRRRRSTSDPGPAPPLASGDVSEEWRVDNTTPGGGVEVGGGVGSVSPSPPVSPPPGELPPSTRPPTRRWGAG